MTPRGRATSRSRVAAVLVSGALACAACTSDPPTDSTSETSSAAASPTLSGASPGDSPPIDSGDASPSGGVDRSKGSGPTAHATPTARAQPRLDTWRVGARPLPLRPDGFGQVLPTPRELRVRRLPTADRLPPPPDERFASSVRPVSPEVRRRMGETWSPSCPVPLSGLRYVRVAFRGFDGAAHTGELVVAAGVARDVVRVFRDLFAASYPIEEMRLPSTADLDAAPTGDGNNTAAYVCRTVRGSSALSAHAYGLAVDVNPFMNPYRKDDLVLPELASAYLDRDRRRPGMILPDDPVTRAFDRVGWTWGGTFRSVFDPMHFSANGR